MSRDREMLFVAAQGNNPFKELAMAVCLLAVEDYKQNYRTSSDGMPRVTRKEIEKDMQDNILWDVAMPDMDFQTAAYYIRKRGY